MIGASCRGIYAFADPLVREYRDTHELVGAFDILPRRIEVMNEYIKAKVPGFTDLDRMMRETRPDLLIISTIDATHADYVEEAFARGIDSIVEKPLCTTAEQCRRILRAAARRPGARLVTALNYRYGPHAMKIKEVIDSGRLGTIRSLAFHELLDRRHGTSYFRRWNRCKKNSGGLLVHKACHCFDLIHWLVGSRARTLVAHGGLTAYGPKASPFRGTRCSECPHASKCPEYVDLRKDTLRSKLYFQSKEPGGYTPDLCVFDPEIDAEDHATVGYECENGVQVSFHLCAHASQEGVILHVEGSKGRLEHSLLDDTAPLAQDGRYGNTTIKAMTLRVRSFEKPAEDIPVEERKGGHWGADPLMLSEILGARPPSHCMASMEDGIQAVLVGAAANLSIAEGRRVDVQSLLRDDGPAVSARA